MERIAAGYARRTIHLHYTSVYFSFSTFLYLAASWTGVDKKIFAQYVQNKDKQVFISFYFIRNQVSDSGLRWMGSSTCRYEKSKNISNK